MLKLRGSTFLHPTTTANHEFCVRPCRGEANTGSASPYVEGARVCVCVCVICTIYEVEGFLMSWPLLCTIYEVDPNAA